MADSVMVDATSKTLGNENNDAKQSKWDCFIDVLKELCHTLRMSAMKRYIQSRTSSLRPLLRMLA